ncbi:IclR family transcriptional regulator [Arthrobacter zhangbolii]|uniref:IclR family transcriptional regulator n=1 Tax=Arthrobacter zhangbolii TaxID=2886936 RepID=A0A9X1M8Y1_9MICC|nr:IclR family transcriptional regulator [Arthrobacter zhangbolii]MCC3273035.1 IclR family transcriptional regulator [Arthrobacter zhangbolii]MCC3295375.1 IclR family transcriptional regulator [Arthrobacter zhangbolii]UON93085.1 IclR family transcriptional regulator [Arthrobacter zhangbolii]
MSASYSRVQVPAAAQVLSILRYLGRQAGPVSAGAVARDLSLPRSTTYHLLAALVADGFAVHLPEESKYALGATAHELGTGYARQAPLQRIGRFPLRKLVTRTRATAHLAVLQGADVIYVIEERAPRQPPLVTDAGVRLPAHRTASGRAMLAPMNQSQLRALYPEADVMRSSRTGGPSLSGLLEQVRERGYAWEEDEVSDGFSSLAVPVLDRAGHAVASVTVTVPTRHAVPGPSALPDRPGHSAPAGHAAPARSVSAAPAAAVEALAEEYLPELNRCAVEISRRLGAPAGP